MTLSTSPPPAVTADGHGPFGPCDLVTREEIAAYLKLTSTQMCRLAKHRCFPEPVVLVGPKSPRWRLGDVAWIAAGGFKTVEAELPEAAAAARDMLSARAP